MKEKMRILLGITIGLLAVGGLLFVCKHKKNGCSNIEIPTCSMEQETPVCTESTPSAPATIHEITCANDLDALVKNPGPKVIKFSAGWCGACVHLGTYYDQIAQECNGVTFYSINVDDQQVMAKAEALNIPKEKIVYLPTIVFLQEGKVHEQMTGALEKETFVKKVKEVFSL